MRRLLTILLLVLCTASFAQNLVYYPAEGEPKAAVVVCPGGSYFWLDQEKEGSLVGRWLASQGISAYVLHYRTAGVLDFITSYRLLFRGHRHPDMISDLQWALQTAREEFDGPVGALGFSAGGHLVMSAAEFFDTDFRGYAGGANLRPDFVAPIYPVVSMSAPCTHKRSRIGLLGEDCTGDPVLRDSLSLELHVRPDTPPVFLLRCDDDPVVDPANADLLDAALTEKGVPHRTVRYRRGGHGFGVDDKKLTEETARWQAEFLDWLEEIDYGRH